MANNRFRLAVASGRSFEERSFTPDCGERRNN
jgi:hypothetical protein